MNLDISEEPIANLEGYARISSSFEVREVFDVIPRDRGLGGFHLSERVLDTPYVKDYDALESPLRWTEMFDLSNWVFFMARSEGARIGGAAVAFNTPGLSMLEGRQDLAVLWDIRVSTETRGMGVGAALFAKAEAWATARGCRRLKIETQNINVPACRFYASQGCVLGAIHRFAYVALPQETQLLWYKDLAPRPDGVKWNPGGPAA